MIVCGRLIRDDGSVEFKVGKLDDLLYIADETNHASPYLEFNRVQFHKSHTFLIEPSFVTLLCGVIDRATKNFTITPFVSLSLDTFVLKRYLASLCDNMTVTTGRITLRDAIPLDIIDKQMREKVGFAESGRWSYDISGKKSHLKCSSTVDREQIFTFEYQLSILDIWAMNLDHDFQKWVQDIFVRMITTARFLKSQIYALIKDSGPSFRFRCNHPNLLNRFVDLAVENEHLLTDSFGDSDAGGKRILEKVSQIVNLKNFKKSFVKDATLPRINRSIINRVLRVSQDGYMWMDLPVKRKPVLINILRATECYAEVMDKCAQIILLAS